MTISRRALSGLAARCLGEAAVVLFPSRCFACERPLPRVQFVGACAACWAQLAQGPRPRCRRCALPLPEAAADCGPAAGCCARCAVRALPFDRAIAAVAYDARARRFLLRAKEGRRREVLAGLAGQLAAAVRLSGLAEGVDAVVPVPSAPLARWRRGFNPAGDLALEVARVTGRPLLRDVLRKRWFGGPSAKALSASARWAGAARDVVARREVSGARLLLVDDVLTTGATATACSLALRAAGALEVRVAVWARTPSPADDFGRTPRKPL